MIGKKFGYEDSPFGGGTVITLKPYTGAATSGAQVAQEFNAMIAAAAAPPPPPPPAPVVKHGFFWHLFHPGHKDA